MASKTIRIRGARVHNLKNVNLDLPRHKLVVFTGPSGSGKSSMAFDTLFAEGQRRYVESMSVYARQYLNRMEKPDVEEVTGLAPTISIEQKATSNNPRSTVGTVTEIYDHLRMLYAKLGEQRCYSCGQTLGAGSVESIVESLASLDDGTKFQVMAPLVRNRRGEFRELFESLRAQGLVRARIDGAVVLLESIDKLHKETRHTIDAVVDRLVARPGQQERIREAVERALRLSDGQALVLYDSGIHEGTERLFSTTNFCTTCEIAYPLLTHQSFSFNAPPGRCPSCQGLGTERQMAEDKLVPDPSLSLSDGAISFLDGYLAKDDRGFVKIFEAFLKCHGISRKTPWQELPVEARRKVMDGVSVADVLTIPGRKTPLKVAFAGVRAWALQHYDEADTEAKSLYYQQFLSNAPCSDCQGARLRPESRSVYLEGVPITDVTHWSIEKAADFFETMTLTGRRAAMGDELRREVSERLGFLRDVGLEYLSLDRPAPSLSGGEAQRIRLASQLGSHLSGVLYVLDEPSIGLHQRDNARLIGTLVALRERGNHVIVVEHDRETIEACDWVVDFGPGAGVHGGEVTFEGTPQAILNAEGNVTGDFLAGRRQIEFPLERRTGNGTEIVVRGAREHNLKNIDVHFPLGTLTVVSGVSGAGKSTVVNEILYPAAHNHAWKTEHTVGACTAVEGLEHIDKVIQIDQAPIGRSSRSNPATYTKVFDEIRKIFAELPESKIYGYKPGRFSFNVGAGRCGRCAGHGVEKIEMRFLADVEVPCPVCRGKRFNDATLRVKYEGYSIADILAMPIEDAARLFEPYPVVRRQLQTLVDVGLGYITLGQSSTTLSGGEAQRVKLARELSKVATGRTLYILDEPSTGLHFEDIQKLLHVLQRLVSSGNTVIVIEHNLEIICASDHVMDIGPDGGGGGGELVDAGTPEALAERLRGYTARFIRAELERAGRIPPSA